MFYLGLRGTGECFEKQEHDFMASIREVMCGAKRQGAQNEVYS
jgi:hypothetical protein